MAASGVNLAFGYGLGHSFRIRPFPSDSPL